MDSPWNKVATKYLKFFTFGDRRLSWLSRSPLWVWLFRHLTDMGWSTSKDSKFNWLKKNCIDFLHRDKKTKLSVVNNQLKISLKIQKSSLLINQESLMCYYGRANRNEKQTKEMIVNIIELQGCWYAQSTYICYTKMSTQIEKIQDPETWARDIGMYVFDDVTFEDSQNLYGFCKWPIVISLMLKALKGKMCSLPELPTRLFFTTRLVIRVESYSNFKIQDTLI